MPSCSNPTAIELSAKRRTELASVINKHHLLLIEDDSFRFLGNLRNKTFFEQIPKNTLYINSTTKSISSGSFSTIHSMKRKEAQKRNALCNSILGINGTSQNPYSFFRWYHFKKPTDSFLHALSAHHISVMESQMFNTGTNDADHYIRIALSSEPDEGILSHALKTIKELSLSD